MVLTVSLMACSGTTADDSGAAATRGGMGNTASGGQSGSSVVGTSGAPSAGGGASMSGVAGMNAANTSGNSCVGMNGTECRGGDCCQSLVVTGGTFEQGDPDAFSSTVSTFELDKFEVTVGRFRNFIAAYDAWRAAGNPVVAAGANANVPGSGWSADFNGSLATNAATLVSFAASDCGDEMYQTWADSGNDTLPLNCVDWYTSFAFCIWEGKRLPTESEWEYATARGANNTTYAWGNMPIPDNTLSTGNLAAYDCLGDGDPDCAFTDILPVGSRPDGDGLFGQADLAGSMWEWILDWFTYYPSSPQTNYANLTPGSTRLIRGGDFASPAATLVAGDRYSYGFPTAHFTNVGFRCAANH
jgi:formylglycine-generating enzyme required for sulfatase activity